MAREKVDNKLNVVVGTNPQEVMESILCVC